MARRFLEAGVRFVQVYSGGGHNDDNWDAHGDLVFNHTRHAGRTDKPIAALLVDLERRGLLDETLVVWGGEFGRTPMVETNPLLGRKLGRDHHPQAFTMWLAGGGFRRGHTHGETDEFGFHVVDGGIHVYDLQATILHTLGFDHEQLTYRTAGRDFRLTDVHGRVATELLA